ncbi:MAG: hypothetical protein WC330_07445 [Candidatus Omnitrophota bacterium]|jgi:hypothetical protein
MKARNVRIFLVPLLCLFFYCNFCFPYTIDTYPNLNPGYSAKKIPFVLVFINYTNEQSYSADLSILNEKLMTTSPFDEFLKNIVVYKIDISREEEKIFFKKTQNFPYVSVRTDLLENIASDVKGAYKLVIVDSLGSLSCAELSLVDKFSLIILGRGRYKNKEDFAKGFMHELGHSFGLRDECSSCNQGRAGFPNCASNEKEAEKWWGRQVTERGRVGYFKGCCGRKDYIRPTIASLMNDPNKARDFGPVNEEYLRDSMTNFLALQQ